MLVDGKAIARKLLGTLKNEVTHASHRPHLTVITCAPSFATKKYVGLKKRLAMEVGIAVNVIELPHEITTEECVSVVNRASMQTDGIIVQLPLPKQVDVDIVMEAIPASYDVDGIHFANTGEGYIPPVVGAIAAIAEHHDILLAGQKVVVVGHGRLVGKPAALWAKNQGAQVQVLTAETEANKEAIEIADILILGAGVPGFIKPENIKPGVIIFDAATSESGGELMGDTDPACADKAGLLTPVPGGIGPVTVAILLHNVLLAAQAVVNRS